MCYESVSVLVLLLVGAGDDESLLCLVALLAGLHGGVCGGEARKENTGMKKRSICNVRTLPVSCSLVVLLLWLLPEAAVEELPEQNEVYTPF